MKISRIALAALILALLVMQAGCSSAPEETGDEENGSGVQTLAEAIAELAGELVYTPKSQPDTDDSADTEATAGALLSMALDRLSEPADGRAFTIMDYREMELSVADAGSPTEYIYGTVELSFEGELGGLEDTRSGAYGTASLGEWSVTQSGESWTLGPRENSGTPSPGDQEDTPGVSPDDDDEDQPAETFSQLTNVISFRDDQSSLSVDEVVRDMLLALLEELMVPDEAARTFTVTGCRSLSPLVMDKDDPNLYVALEGIGENTWYVSGVAELRYEGTISPNGPGEDIPEGEYATVDLGEWWLYREGTVYSLEPFAPGATARPQTS